MQRVSADTHLVMPYGVASWTRAIRTGSRAGLLTRQNRERDTRAHSGSSTDQISRVGINWESTVSADKQIMCWKHRESCAGAVRCTCMAQDCSPAQHGCREGQRAVLTTCRAEDSSHEDPASEKWWTLTSEVRVQPPQATQHASAQGREERLGEEGGRERATQLVCEAVRQAGQCR